MDQGDGVSEGGAAGGTAVRKCNLVAQSPSHADRSLQTGGREAPDRQRHGALGTTLFQGVQESAAGDRASARDGRPDAGHQQVAGLLSRDDLCGFSGRSEPGQQRGSSVAFDQSNVRAATPRDENELSRRVVKSLVTSLRPRRSRLRLGREAYDELRRQVLERDGWRCQNCGNQKTCRHITSNQEAAWETTPLKI